MEFTQTFTDLALGAIHEDAQKRKEEGWRYVQMLAVNKSCDGFEGVDLIYSYMLNGELLNLVVSDVPRDAEVESISDIYLAAFVWENEVHDLFGITFNNIAIDFLGNFYRVSTEYPMTIISPEQLARREKERKAAEARAKKAAEKQSAADDKDMEAKLANMDPEKAAKVRAAMAAKKKAVEKQSASQDAELEAKLANMDPEKAAKVRAAMEAKRAKEEASSGEEA